MDLCYVNALQFTFDLAEQTAPLLSSPILQHTLNHTHSVMLGYELGRGGTERVHQATLVQNMYITYVCTLTLYGLKTTLVALPVVDSTSSNLS